MAQKRARQRAILELIGTHAIGSQEELRVLLDERGMRVTQATLSRDLRELRIVRVPTVDGARYRVGSEGADEGKPSLQGLLPQFFASVDGVGELIVLRTLPGGAQPIAEAIDSQKWPETLGTLAGENTVLIICRSADARQRLIARFEELATPRPGG